MCLVIALSSVAHADPAGTHLGIGVLAGMSSEHDPLGGVRAIVHVVDAKPGSLRAVAQLLYARWQDRADLEHRWDVFATSAALEYVAPVSLPFFIAAGAGLGYDIVQDNYDHPRSGHTFAAARLSPTLNVGTFDVGLHLQLVYSDRMTVLGEVGIDYVIK